ncbi:MAG: sulfatase-like hydrolase/transferase [Opitutales bacterium]
MADDLGYGDLACYGQTRINTPHIDRMAAEGMRFTNAYSGFTVCAPSRSVLVTGQHTGHARVPSNGSGPLRPEDLTVAEVLKNAGYRTGLIGKWGLGEEETTGAPWRQGFDRFYGYLNQGHAHNFYPEFIWSDEEKVQLRNHVIRFSSISPLRSRMLTTRGD